MPRARGRDRVEPTTDGTVVLLSLHPKDWAAREEAAGRALPRPGTAVRWDDALYEVLRIEPRAGGGFRHVLAPWDERQLVRSYVEYAASDEPAPGSPATSGEAVSAPRPGSRAASFLAGLPRPVRVLAPGFVTAVLLGWFFPFRVMGEGMSALVHELGHTATAWIFGCTALPAIVMTIAFEQVVAVAVLVWGGLVFAAVRYRHVPRWNVALGAIAAVYPLLAFTRAHLTLFDLGGHLAEAAVAAWALRRALREDGPEWERPVWSFFGFYLVARNVKLFGGVALSASARTDYLTIAITGQNDLTKVAATTGISLEALAAVTACMFLAGPLIAILPLLRPSRSSVPPAVALLAAMTVFTSACGGERQATLLYVTDAHEIAPVKDRHGERGGVARLKTVVDRVKGRRPDALLVFGGDLAGGTLFGGVFHGEPMVDALGRAGVGLATFGQHEFDFGEAQARRLLTLSRFPWITSNLVDGAGKPFAGLPTRLVRSVGGLRVGFLGLTDDMQTTTPEGLVFQNDLVSRAKEEAERLEHEGAEAIVALTQTGPATNERLLREVPLLDAILTEEEAEERSVVRFVGARPIAAPCGNIGSVVELRLVARRGARVRSEVLAHPVDASVPADPALAALEREFMARLDESLKGHVAELAAGLPASRAGDGELALGNLVADAFREAVGAQAALVPGSSLRADLPAGPLTRRELFAVLPFGNRVVMVELAGKDLRAVLEAGLAPLDRGAAPLQVSGLSYSADAGAPAGARLRSLLIAGVPVRGDRLYRVAVSSYLAAGGEGLAPLARAKRVPVPGGEPLDADALAAHLARLGAGGPARSPETGRISLKLR